MLYAVNADGTDTRVVAGGLEVHGALAWKADGRSLTVAAVMNGIPRLFDVPLDGHPPTAFVAEHSVDPVWSPCGDIAAFSGADVPLELPPSRKSPRSRG